MPCHMAPPANVPTTLVLPILDSGYRSTLTMAVHSIQPPFWWNLVSIPVHMDRFNIPLLRNRNIQNLSPGMPIQLESQVKCAYSVHFDYLVRILIIKSNLFGLDTINTASATVLLLLLLPLSSLLLLPPSPPSSHCLSSCKTP